MPLQTRYSRRVEGRVALFSCVKSSKLQFTLVRGTGTCQSVTKKMTCLRHWHELQCFWFLFLRDARWIMVRFKIRHPDETQTCGLLRMKNNGDKSICLFNSQNVPKRINRAQFNKETEFFCGFTQRLKRALKEHLATAQEKCYGKRNESYSALTQYITDVMTGLMVHVYVWG